MQENLETKIDRDYLIILKKAMKERYKKYIKDDYQAGLVDGYLMSLDDLINSKDNLFKTSI
jgi:hypothetical protein